MSAEKNTMPESFDEQPVGVETLSQEDILMNERDLLQGLIEAGKQKDSPTSYEKIQIRRNGKLYFEFRIRPVSEEESQRCHRYATKYAPRRKGQPEVELTTDAAKFRSWLIYTATINEDRKKLWDNKKAQEQFNVLTGVEVIDQVLLSGEKDRILDRINEISGYGEDDITDDELAKN